MDNEVKLSGVVGADVAPAQVGGSVDVPQELRFPVKPDGEPDLSKPMDGTPDLTPQRKLWSQLMAKRANYVMAIKMIDEGIELLDHGHVTEEAVKTMFNAMQC